MKTARMGLLVASLAVLVACGGGTKEAEKKPAPPKVYTAAQLQAALPGVEDIPSGKEETSACPGDKTCKKPEDGAVLSKGFALDLPFTGVEAEKAAKDGIPDFVNLDVYQNTTAVVAATDFAKERKKRSAYDGSFDEKAVKTKRGFTFGLKGAGTLEDTKVSGWSGYFSERDIMLTNVKGGDEGSVRDNQLRVQQGNVTVGVVVGSGQGRRSLDECEKIARQIAEDYLTRLG